MKLEIFQFDSKSGWSQDEFPAMDSDKTVVIVFGASEFLSAPAPIREIALAYPNSHLIGCSSSGEILGSKLSDGTLSVAVLQLDHGSVTSACTLVSAPDQSYEAGQKLARKLQDPSLRGVLVLSDGLAVNGSELARGLSSVLPESVAITGGLAGDGDRFERTWVIERGEPRSGAVSAVGLHGDRLRLGHGSKGGWDMFGPERTITRSEGSVLFELDGKPALDLYKEYLGDRASGLPATGLLFPLALRTNSLDGERIVRTILAVDEDAHSMTFAGDVPEGSRAQLMRANFDRLVEGASGAALMTKNGGDQCEETLAIAISCVGRRLVLGERTEEEIEATLDVLPANTKQIGFYSYGELSPLANGRCDLHNQTMTLTTISEV